MNKLKLIILTLFVLLPLCLLFREKAAQAQSAAAGAELAKNAR